MIPNDYLELNYKSLSFFFARGGSVVKTKEEKFQDPLASLAPFKTLGEVKQSVHTLVFFAFVCVCEFCRCELNFSHLIILFVSILNFPSSHTPCIKCLCSS